MMCGWRLACLVYEFYVFDGESLWRDFLRFFALVVLLAR